MSEENKNKYTAYVKIEGTLTIEANSYEDAEEMLLEFEANMNGHNVDGVKIHIENITTDIIV